jgi:predicted CXXCH cytochrome family protein
MAQDAKALRAVDPSAWGESHAGQPVPEYEDGNTCLFCHRTSIGPGWQTNRHATTLRTFADDPNAPALKTKAGDAELVLGRRERLRFLRSTGAYGTLSLLGLSWSPAKQAWLGEGNWNETKFATSCAGCHTSGVDSLAKTFQTPSLDCHTCHGIAVSEHTHDGALMLLSPKGSTRAEVEISICGSCHLRGGKSKSTGLPFPNNFVPGDNLFKDYEADLSESRIQQAAPDEAHILQNIRDVALLGRDDMACSTCHEIHKESSAKHAKLAERTVCFACHMQGGSMKATRRYERHSTSCEY